MKNAKSKAQSVDKAMLAAIRRRGTGSVFVPADFLGLGSREAVDIALHRLTQAGTIRRLARGGTTTRSGIQCWVFSIHLRKLWQERWRAATGRGSSLRAPTRPTPLA